MRADAWINSKMKEGVQEKQKPMKFLNFVLRERKSEQYQTAAELSGSDSTMSNEQDFRALKTIS